MQKPVFERDPSYPIFKLPTVAELQKFADLVNKALMVLPSNERIAGHLEEFYEQALDWFDEGTKKHCKQSLKQFRMELWDLRTQHEMQIDHLRAIRDKVEGGKEYVSEPQPRLPRLPVDRERAGCPAVEEPDDNLNERAGAPEQPRGRYDAHHHHHHPHLPTPDVRIRMLTQKPSSCTT